MIERMPKSNFILRGIIPKILPKWARNPGFKNDLNSMVKKRNIYLKANYSIIIKITMIYVITLNVIIPIGAMETI
jgi:hypothetical protein